MWRVIIQGIIFMWNLLTCCNKKYFSIYFTHRFWNIFSISTLQLSTTILHKNNFPLLYDMTATCLFYISHKRFLICRTHATEKRRIRRIKTFEKQKSLLHIVKIECWMHIRKHPVFSLTAVLMRENNRHIFS